MAAWRGRVLAATAVFLSVVVLTGSSRVVGVDGRKRPSRYRSSEHWSDTDPGPEADSDARIDAKRHRGNLRTVRDLRRAGVRDGPAASRRRRSGVVGGTARRPGGPGVRLWSAGPASAPTLSWSRVLDPGETRDLLATVDAKVTPQSDLLGPVDGLKDNGSAALLRFSYAGQPDQEVLVRLTGCEPASSNHGTTTFRPDIVKAIRALHR